MELFIKKTCFLSEYDLKGFYRVFLVNYSNGSKILLGVADCNKKFTINNTFQVELSSDDLVNLVDVIFISFDNLDILT